MTQNNKIFIKYLEYLEGKTFYVTVIIFSLMILEKMYQYYSSGEFIDGAFGQDILTGWMKWVLWFGFSVVLITLILLASQTALSDLSGLRKSGVLLVIIGFVLSLIPTDLIDVIGFSSPWEQKIILTLCYVNLICFAMGTGLLKVTEKRK